MNRKGFTLIELLVVIFIIALISTIAMVALNNARSKSRDVKRASDIRQIITAMSLYQEEANDFPATMTAGGSIAYGTRVYMVTIPTAPLPADGTCSSSQNSYSYTYVNAHSFTIVYCLGENTGEISSGLNTATPASMY